MEAQGPIGGSQTPNPHPTAPTFPHKVAQGGSQSPTLPRKAPIRPVPNPKRRLPPTPNPPGGVPEPHFPPQTPPPSSWGSRPPPHASPHVDVTPHTCPPARAKTRAGERGGA